MKTDALIVAALLLLGCSHKTTTIAPALTPDNPPLSKSESGKTGIRFGDQRFTAKTPAPPTQAATVAIFFRFDDYQVVPEAAAILAAYTQAHPAPEYWIYGATCTIGTAEYNETLGARRAQAAAAVIPAPSHRITWGESRATGPTPGNRKCIISTEPIP
ncbi:hypothetical protein CCP3SC15_300009 [Gammaproteobacteria bacterium]